MEVVELPAEQRRQIGDDAVDPEGHQPLHALGVVDRPDVDGLPVAVRRLHERLEDMEDLMELRAAVERNAGKPGTPWEQVKAELDLD